MDKKEKVIEASSRIIEKSKDFYALESSEEFISWREQAFEGRLMQLILDAMGADMSQGEGVTKATRSILAFQELMNAYSGIFKYRKRLDEVARETLKKYK